MVVALAMFVMALLMKSDDLKKVSLGVFLMISLIAIPTYASGNAAQEMIANHPGISMALIDAHQGYALLALIFMEFAGIVSWLGLWQYRRRNHFASWTLPAVGVLGLITFGLMAQAANIGGEISHPEIRASATSNGSEYHAPIDVPALAKGIKSSKWIWAACETLHFMGMSMLFGVVILVDLRMLGAMKGVSFEAIHRVLPWGVFGFALNVVTGMTFFIAASSQYTTNVVFHWKLALILVAGVNALYFTLFDETWLLKAGQDAPGSAKFAAASALVLWIGIIYAGRMLPFIGNAF
jgi:hypothetical protein